jgi:hypothetical protein
MNELLARHFARMGARLQVRDLVRPRFVTGPTTFQIDIQKDNHGEFFELRLGRDELLVQALDVQPADRHLLLLVREDQTKHKFLCGHDERAWFVAAVPGQSASTVRTAKLALKPRDVHFEEVRRGVPDRKRFKRRNAASVRQGEWFFVPAPDAIIDPKWVLRDEPLVRGGGKPHRAELCHRQGGETVYVSPRRARPLTDRQFEKLSPRERAGFTVMRRNPAVFVRGHVRHADHKTIYLPGWHRVLLNTEQEAPSMRNVAFLD